MPCSHDEAREYFFGLQNDFIQWNYTAQDDPEYRKKRALLMKKVEETG